MRFNFDYKRIIPFIVVVGFLVILARFSATELFYTQHAMNNLEDLPISELSTSNEEIVSQIGIGRLNDLAYAPDGHVLTIATSKGIAFYDPIFHELENFWSSDHQVSSLAWAPDSKKLAAKIGGEIRIIDPENETHNILPTSESFTLAEMTWSPDGRYMALDKPRGEVLLWDTHLEEWKPIINNAGKLPLSGTLSWSPDSQKIAIGHRFGPLGSSMEEIRIWNITSDGILEQSWPAPEFNATNVIGWHPSGDYLLIAGPKSLSVFDIVSGSVVSRLDTWIATDEQAIFSDYGGAIAIAGHFDSLQILNFPSLRPIAKVEGDIWIEHISLHPEKKLIVGGSSTENQVAIWNSQTGQLMETINLESYWADDLAWSPEGDQIAILDRSGLVQIYDPYLMAHITTLGDEISGAVKGSIDWSFDGQWLAWSGPRSEGREQDLVTYVSSIDGSYQMVIDLPNGQWLPDANKLVFLQKESLQIWEVNQAKAPEQVARLLQPSGQSWMQITNNIYPPRMTTWALSPDGQSVAVGIRRYGDEVLVDRPAEIIILKVTDGLPVIRTIRLNGSYIRSLAWEPQSEQIAASFDDTCWRRSCSKLEVWSVTSGQKTVDLKYQESSAWQLSWSPDGQWLASTSGPNGGNVTFYNVEDGGVFELDSIHRGRVGTIEWSPTGRLISSNGYGGNMIILKAEPLLHKFASTIEK